MTSPVSAEHRRLRRELGRRADRSQGRFLRHYLGSPLPVLGVRVPQFRELLAESRVRLEALSLSARLALARSLWNGRTFEERALAIALLVKFVPPDEPRAWRLTDRWVDSATGWALSDGLAAGPVARSVARDPRHFAEILRWTRSRNLWRRRAATYALHDWVSRESSTARSASSSGSSRTRSSGSSGRSEPGCGNAGSGTGPGPSGSSAGTPATSRRSR